MTIARATPPLSDLDPIVAFRGSGTAELPATEGTAFSGIVRFEQFVQMQLRTNNVSLGSVSGVVLRVRVSDLDVPDPTDDTQWSAGDEVLLSMGTTGAPGATVRITPPTAKWVSFGVWVSGSAVGADIQVEAFRIPGAAAVTGEPAPEWVEVTDSTPGITDYGDVTDATVEYVSDRWRVTFNGTGPAENGGGEDDWPSKIVPLETLLPGFAWATHDLYLRIDLVTMSNTANDGGPGMNVQFNDGLSIGNPLIGYGYTDHAAILTRWARETATTVQVIGSETTADIRTIVARMSSNGDGMLASATLYGAANAVLDSDTTKSGSGFGTDLTDMELRLGGWQGAGGPMPATTVNEFRVYYAKVPRVVAPTL